MPGRTRGACSGRRPRGTVPGGQEAGRLTGAQPADPDEADEAED